MNQKHDYIAVFDSGVGGLSVLRELRKTMPEERYLYFGDSANAPYGTRTHAEVLRLTEAAVQRLLPRGLKALVVACNTATAAAINALRAMHPDLIIIGIEPAVKLAAARHPGGPIGVMATQVTLREERFEDLISRAGMPRVLRLPAPGLVELVEQGRGNSSEAEALLRPILEPLRGKLPVLVLGCTHYPFAARAISRILGEGTELLDGSEGTARETRRRLEAAGLLGEGPGETVLEDSLPQPEILELARQLLEQPL